MTPQEFAALPREEKIKVLRERRKQKFDKTKQQLTEIPGKIKEAVNSPDFNRTAAGVVTGAGAEILGSPLAAVTGGLSTIPVGAAGYAAGTGLYDLINSAINNSFKTPEQTMKDTGKDLLTGAETSAVGGIMGGVPLRGTEKIAGVVDKAVSGIKKIPPAIGNAAAKYKSVMTKIPKEDIVNYYKGGMPNAGAGENAISAQEKLLSNFKQLTKQEGANLARTLKTTKGNVSLDSARRSWLEEISNAEKLKTAAPTKENIDDYNALVQSYKEKFEAEIPGSDASMILNPSGKPAIPAVESSSTPIGNVDPYNAWMMQRKMVKPARYDATKQTSDAVQAAERRASRSSYDAINEELSRTTSGVSQEMKDKMSGLHKGEDELGNLVDNPESMETFLRNYNNPTKEVKKLALKRISQQHPELNIDKQVSDAGVINSFSNPPVLRNDTMHTLGTTGGVGTLLHQTGMPTIPAYAAGLAESSPYLLKKQIDLLRMLKPGMSKVSNVADRILPDAADTIPMYSRYETAKDDEEEE